jgi:DNA-binding transcriptional ArsR family regulator
MKITERDMVIFEVLAQNPATVSDLFERYKKASDKPDLKTTASAFRKRLATLKRGGYLKCGPSGKYTLYALDTSAVEKLRAATSGRDVAINNRLPGETTKGRKKMFYVTDKEVVLSARLDKSALTPRDLIREIRTVIVALNEYLDSLREADSSRVIITERDVDIFRSLASGALTIKEILSEVNGMGRRDPKSLDDRGERYGKRTSPAAMKLRLHVLRKAGFLKSSVYDDEKGKPRYALYVLCDPAVEMLTARGVKLNHIRHLLPGKYHGYHERVVVHVVKKMKQEAFQAGYGLELWDELAVKERFGRIAKKGVAYPDLHVVVSFLDAGAKKQTAYLAIEIDNGTIPVPQVIQRALYLYKERKWITMLLSRDPQRLASLRSGFLEYLQRLSNSRGFDQALYQCAFFSTAGEFLAKGFLQTKWKRIHGDDTPVIPDGAKPIRA